MLKTLLGNALFVIIMLLFFQCPLKAQYTVDNHYVGPSIGLSFLGSTFQIGGNYEYALNVENFGKIGVGGIFRYWGYSDAFNTGKLSYTNIFIGAQGNYHFEIKGNDQLDPYAGLVLAYDGGSVSYSGPAGNYATPSQGGVWLGFQGGIRYFINPNLAITGRVGFGTLSYGALELGVDFKL
jgi:hypothetical protein